MTSYVAHLLAQVDKPHFSQLVASFPVQVSRGISWNDLSENDEETDIELDLRSEDQGDDALVEGELTVSHIQFAMLPRSDISI